MNGDTNQEAANTRATSGFAKSQGSRRNVVLDLARMLAAWGVVTLHVPWTSEGGKLLNQIFWVTCVPFFYTAGLVFYIQSFRVAKIGSNVQKLFYRLIVPYLSWTAIYIALLQVKAALDNKVRAIDWIGSILYGKSSLHLYFVPTLFALLVLATAYLSIRLGRGASRYAGWGLLALGVGYFALGCSRGYYNGGGYGFFAAVCIYVVSAHLIARHMNDAKLNVRWALLGLVIWLTSIALNVCNVRFIFNNVPLLLPLGGIGFCLFVLGDWGQLNIKDKWNLLTTSYGIYLGHVLILELLELCIKKSGHHFDYSFFNKVAMTSFIFFASAAFTVVARKNRYLSYLLLGEGNQVKK